MLEMLQPTSTIIFLNNFTSAHFQDVANSGVRFVCPMRTHRQRGLAARSRILCSVLTHLIAHPVSGWFPIRNTLQSITILYRVTDSCHSKTSARAPDGLGQGASGQPVLPANPPDHQIDRQRCDRASLRADSPCIQPPLTVCINPHARSHVAWRITHYDQYVSYTRRASRPGQSACEPWFHIWHLSAPQWHHDIVRLTACAWPSRQSARASFRRPTFVVEYRRSRRAREPATQRPRRERSRNIGRGGRQKFS